MYAIEIYLILNFMVLILKSIVLYALNYYYIVIHTLNT